MDQPLPITLDGMIDHAGNPLAKMPDEIHPSSNAVLFNDAGEVLLQRRADNGLWGLPGGRHEIGESSEACAIRECWEETGIMTRAKRLVGIYSDPGGHNILRYPNGYTVHYVVAVFEVEYVSGEIAVSSESTEVRYWPVSALPDEIAPAARLRVNDTVAGQVAAFSK
ncbi:MAG: NUDIX domain-containing protein [Chloroflexi bacterium]|nr:NUDIX domain-containing protein [Chloroflexota bacterium]